MPDDVDISVEFDVPHGDSPSWLRDIADTAHRWTRQMNPWSGSQTPQEQPPPPAKSYVVEIPMFWSLPKEEAQSEAAGALESEIPQAAEASTTEFPKQAEAPSSEASSSEPLVAVFGTPESPQIPEQTSEALAALEDQGPQPEVSAGADEGGSEESPSGGTLTPEAILAETPTQESPTSVAEEVGPSEESTPSKPEESTSPVPPTTTTPELTSPENPEAEKEQEIPVVVEAQPAPVAPILEVPQPDYPELLEAVWFAGVAFSGAGAQYSFWEGYQQDKGLDFGYDETNGSKEGSQYQALVGMWVRYALFVGDFGSSTSDGGGGGGQSVGPASFGASGTGTIQVDVRHNNQMAIAVGMVPEDYEPPRDGSGPVTFPSRTGVAAIGVISIPGDTDPNTVQMPPTWWMMSSKMQKGDDPEVDARPGVIGMLCAGTISAGASTLEFTAPNDITVSILSLTNCPGSIVPKQFDTFSGTITDPETKKQIALSITPSLPYPWPATKTDNRGCFAEPKRS